MDKEEITLRDYFAAKVMQAIITKQGTASDYHWESGQSDKKPELAEKCYDMADTMIKVRNK